MKKKGLLNSHISKMAADLGHTDTFCIADVGLPTFDIHKIDLAIEFGIPSLMQIANLIDQHIEIESIVLAEEIKKHNPNLHNQITDKFKHIDIKYISHEDFKEMIKNCKSVIRTGENTPFGNIIFKSGVVFE